MPKDLRTYLTEYERAHPNQVVRVRERISSAQEITALVTAVERQQRYPIFIFENVLTADGRLSAFPLVTNLFASHSRCAELLGCSSRTVAREYYQRTRQQPIPPLVVRREEAPVKEVVCRGEAIDLHAFPAPVHNFMDPGPYFSAGFLTTYDPDSGIDNCALQRGWMKERDRVRIWMYRETHNALNFDKYERAGREMPCAYWVGHHPLACLAAQVRLGYPESHFAAMGGLLQEPLRLVPSETLGDEFLVPADAEVVVEGYMQPGVRVPEGPFGEYPGYTGPQVPGTEMRVTAITHRRDAIWHTIMAGYSDHQVMGSLAIEAALYEDVKKRVPSLENVHLPLSGACRFHAYLQLRNPRPGDAREAILRALTVDYRIKHVFVVDDDIDIWNDREVLFALATRTMWDRDVVIVPALRGYDIDPMVTGPYACKGGIDCTKPVGEPFSERNRPAAEVLERFRLEAYLSAEELARIPPEQQ
jgi:2,5-furandicarboxylate decarboxylase 1